MSFLNTIFWDPNPNLFIIPYLDHPLRWYGLLFMGGMVAGFFILYLLLKEKLQNIPQLQERDIASWVELRKGLALAAESADSPLSATNLHLDKNTRQQIQNDSELPLTTKNALLQSLGTVKRSQLESLLPKAFIPVKEISFKYVDGLMWWFVLATILGARLGHVFFYEWSYYQYHLSSILKVWEGGLASHGGTVGILLAIYFYSHWKRKQFPEISCVGLADLLAIPVAFGIIFIRIGNFVNQEILGNPSLLPWAVIFGHPIDGGPSIPRHPVQLYEAIAYFLTFVLLTTLWKLKKGQWAEGFIIGLFFICVFGSRFFLEFFKASQVSGATGGDFLEIGQILSLPFIVLGAALIYFSQTRRNHDFSKRQSQY